MNYIQMRSMDISNGEGVGCSLFVSGCKFHCKDCFNSESWDFNSGKPFDSEAKSKLIELASKPYISRITILGGEPLADGNYQEIGKLIPELPKKQIWLFTGYTFEELLQDQNRLDVISMVDVLVEGRFVAELKDISLRFRGSSNQRILDAKSSVREKQSIYYYSE